MTADDLERMRITLRQMLNLVADAAIAADDAIGRNDADALRRAMSALADNVAMARRIAAEFVLVSHA